MKHANFFVTCPAFDLNFSFECRRFIRKLFGIDCFYGFMASRVCATFAIFVIVKSFGYVV